MNVHATPPPVTEPGCGDDHTLTGRLDGLYDAIAAQFDAAEFAQTTLGSDGALDSPHACEAAQKVVIDLAADAGKVLGRCEAILDAANDIDRRELADGLQELFDDLCTHSNLMAVYRSAIDHGVPGHTGSEESRFCAGIFTLMRERAECLRDLMRTASALHKQCQEEEAAAETADPVANPFLGFPKLSLQPWDRAGAITAMANGSDRPVEEVKAEMQNRDDRSVIFFATFGHALNQVRKRDREALFTAISDHTPFRPWGNDALMDRKTDAELDAVS